MILHDNTCQSILTSEMIQFSIDSIDYCADKLSQCRCLSDESLNYLTQQTSAIIFNLLQVGYSYEIIDSYLPLF
jgi:hypothetical protein